MTAPTTSTEGNPNRFRWFTAAVIILMIVLMVFSTNTMSRSQRMAHGVLIGTSSSGDVMSQDSHYATQLIDQLSQLSIMDSGGPGRTQQFIPILPAIWGESVVRDLKAHPEALYLALREARRVSPGVNPYVIGPIDPEQQNPELVGIFNSGRITVDDLRPLPSSPLGYARATSGRNMMIQLSVRQQTKEHVAQVPPNALSPLEQQSLYAAIYDLLTLQSAASLPLNALKPTAPMIDRLLAQRLQTFQLQVAGIDAPPFLAKVPEPTDDQLREQLNRYASINRGSVTPANGFGFGYRVPDRVKLEMISFKRAEVRKVVEAEKTPYEWEVEARMAYAKDPSLAAATPSTQPTTAPTTPQPFDAVKDAVINATIERQTDVRSAEIEKAIRSPMMLDYQLWSNATTTRPGMTTKPAGEPPKTSLGVVYNTPDYLEKLAAQVAARFKVKPTVELYTDRMRDINALSALGAFNDATRPVPPEVMQRLGRDADQVNGPQYAIYFAKDLLDQDKLEKLGGLVLESYRPSERLELNRDSGRDREVFIFRITEAQKNHPATDIEPIREQLKNDWRVAEAQRLAVAEAQKAADAANAGTAFEAAVAGVAPGAQVFTASVGPFLGNPPANNPIGISQPAYGQFGAQVTEKLLSESITAAALDVPLAGKAFVAKRLDVKGLWSSAQDLEEQRVSWRAGLAHEMARPSSNLAAVPDDVAATWLDSKRIFERFSYKPVAKDKENE